MLKTFQPGDLIHFLPIADAEEQWILVLETHDRDLWFVSQVFVFANPEIGQEAEISTISYRSKEEYLKQTVSVMYPGQEYGDSNAENQKAD